MPTRVLPLWMKLVLFLLVVLLPSLVVLVLSFRNSLSFLADLAINADVEAALASNLDALRRLHELSPEASQATNFNRHQVTYQAYAQLREIKTSLVATFQEHAFIVGLAALLVSLVLAFGLARNIVKLFKRYSEMLLDKQHHEASLRVLENWQMVSESVIHELKSSLTPLCLFSDMLAGKQPRLDPEAAQVIACEVGKMQTLIDELTGFARLPAVACEEGDLLATLAYLQKHFVVDGLQLKVDATELEGGVCRISHDAAMLQRLLFNLMRNAKEANRDNRNLLFCVSLRYAGAWLQMDITDDGCGIPPDRLSSIFEPRVSRHDRPLREISPMRLPSNLGLGLTISKKIALDHGGDLFARPSPKGAHFVLLLPRYPKAVRFSDG